MNNATNTNVFGFVDDKLLGLIRLCPRKKFNRGNRILDVGDEIVLIPFVMKGNIKVVRNDESGREILLYTINPGESCAMSIASGLNNKPSGAIAITETDTEAYLVPLSLVHETFVSHPEMREFVLELFHRRFNEMINIVDEIAFKSVDFRLLRLLNKRQIKSGKFIQVTHQELANDLGTAREVVSRLLKQLEKQGLIKNYRGKIEILGHL